jgi:hypothetical protein
MPSKLAILVFAAFLAACGKEKPAEKSPAGPDSSRAAASGQSRLVGSERAADLAALEDSVRVRALRGDTVGLVRLMLNDTEYREFIYPVSPAYDSSREEVFKFVAGMHKANSIKGLKRLLADARDPSAGVSGAGSFGARAIPGGVLHEAIATSAGASGFRLFSAAFCRPEGCQVVSFAEAGAHGGGRGD